MKDVGDNSPDASKRARQAYVAASGQQRAARRALLIALGVFLLVVSLSALTLAPRYFAAQRVAAAFCSALRGQDYAAAYALLGSDARDGLTQSSYVAAMRTLDSADGPVSGCVAGVLAGYLYTPGQPVASDTLTVTRPRATFSGPLSLTFSASGGWRIISAPSSMYGAPLAPLAVVADYCAALRGGDYATAYTYFSVAFRQVEPQSAYVAAQRIRDTLVGRITRCGVIGLSSPDTQTLNALLSVTRATGPLQGGEMQLQPDGTAWRIDQFDPAIEGVDVGPYLAGQSFCADVAAGDFGGVYGLLTSSLQAQTTLSQLSAALIPAPGARWSCGQPEKGSYTVSGATASYRVTLSSTGAGGAPSQRTVTLSFALIDGAWLISGY